MRQIPLHKVYIPPRDELMPALEETLYSGYIAEGKKVQEFERAFGEFVGCDKVVAVSSCTAALHLALILAGVGPVDEVVSTPMTAEPTNIAIHMAGARVRWADVDPMTGNMSEETVRSIVKSDQMGYSSAIMVVHYGGIPVKAFENKLPIDNLPIIEDCAHALGASPIGWGDYQCYSFQAIKHLTTVEGGMLVIPGADEETLARAKRLRFFGIDRAARRTSVDVAESGWKYNFNDTLATIGLAQMRHVGKNMQAVQGCGDVYNFALQGIPGLQVWQPPEGVRPAYWLYTVLAEQRDDLARKLTERGIGCGLVHRRNDDHSVFSYARRRLPGLDAFYSHMLHIPCGWWVETEDLDYIIETIRSGW